MTSLCTMYNSGRIATACCAHDPMHDGWHAMVTWFDYDPNGDTCKYMHGYTQVHEWQHARVCMATCKCTHGKFVTCKCMHVNMQVHAW